MKQTTIFFSGGVYETKIEYVIKDVNIVHRGVR